VKIIGYTGLLSENEEEKCKYFGMDAFMQKPATEMAFNSCIE